MNVFRPVFVVGAQRGVTLVELLVALVMGLVLLAGVATVFLANKETYRSQEALARVQENGRFALALLTRELRFGGHRGCSSLYPGKDVVTPARSGSAPPWQSTPFVNFPRLVEGFEFLPAGGTWQPALDSHFNNLASGPTGDVLMVTAVDGVGGRVSTMRQTPVSPTRVDVDVEFVGDLGIPVAQFAAMVPMVLVSDCGGAAVLPVSNAVVAGTSPPRVRVTGSIDMPLERMYPSAASAAEVQRVGKWAYYVAPTVTGEPALWRWNGVGGAQEMVEGVERLEVMFGVDANGDQQVDVPYVDATAAPTDRRDADRFWSEVISVRIAVWVRSGPGVIPTNPAQRLEVDLDLDGDTTDPGESVSFTDGRLRQVFTTTVALRNRML